MGERGRQAKARGRAEGQKAGGWRLEAVRDTIREKGGRREGREFCAWLCGAACGEADGA